MCVVDHVLSKVFKKSSYAYDIQQHGFAIATGKVTLKYIFLLFIWNFSWILGILSFIYLYSLAKKLGYGSHNNEKTNTCWQRVSSN